MTVELNRILSLSSEQFAALPPPPNGYCYSVIQNRCQRVSFRCERPIKLERSEDGICISTIRLKLYTVAQVTDKIMQKMQEIWADDAVMTSYDGTRNLSVNIGLLKKWVSRREFFVIEEKGDFIGFFFTGFSQDGKKVEIALAFHPSHLKNKEGRLTSGRGLGEEAAHAIVNTYLPTTAVEDVFASTARGSQAGKIFQKLGFTYSGDRQYLKHVDKAPL